MDNPSKLAVVERPADQDELPYSDPESQPADQKIE